MKLDTDRVISLTAMLIGLGSLFIIVYQTMLTREAQHASVLPYLSIVITSTNDGVSVNLANVGIGPALIDGIRVRDQGRVHEGDLHDFFVARFPEEKRFAVDKVLRGRLIPAGQNVQMLGMDGAQPGQEFLAGLLRLVEIADAPRAWVANVGGLGGVKAVIEVDYSSVYGDRWRLTSDRVVPEPR